VVEAGGIGRAAEQLNIAKSAVSRRLSELEKRLGIKLINRTTRTSSLTDAGRGYYQQAVKVVDHINEMNGEIIDADAALSGTLRLALPQSFGLLHLSPLIDEFSTLHPELEFQIDFADRQVDVVEEGVDLAFRIADLKDTGLQARRICPINHILVASPSYLAKHGTPKTPDDLKHHKILKYAANSASSWHITDENGKEHGLHLNAKMQANNGDFLLQMAIAGHGILLLPTFLVSQSCNAGNLAQVLAHCTLPSLNAYAVYPKNRYLPQRARLLIDFMVQKFGDKPYWDEGF
jgi:DNA-binding transcriptional LysR family regulator